MANTKDVLGEFEHHVLLTAMRLGDNAYSVSIVQEMEARIGREVSAAAVYIALRRLEENGLVRSESRTGEGDQRSRRFFVVTARGLAMVREARRRLLRLWEGLGPMLTGR